MASTSLPNPGNPGKPGNPGNPGDPGNPPIQHPQPPNPPGSNTVTVEIPQNYQGVISGLCRSGSFQRVIVKGEKPGGQRIFRSNLIGVGDNNTPLKSEIDHSTGGIPFGPFDQPVTLIFTIESGPSSNGPFRPSRVIKPVTVNRPPSGNHRHHTQVSTILSEDGDDNDFNDAIITVFAFK